MAIDQSILLENLNSQQKEAVLCADGPVLILAGAGSGKTRTIVHRMAHLIHIRKVNPSKIVALTFTNKAAQEMQERALQIAGPIAANAQVRTFHSFGLWLLRIYASHLQYPSNFAIWDDGDQRACIERICHEHYKDRYNKNQIRYFYSKISAFKDALMSPETVAEEVNLEDLENGDVIVDIYKLYEINKTNSSAFDFGDLIYQSVYLLQNDTEVLEQLQSRFEYFMVDEYQDTNHAQYAMINLLAQKNLNLCVVGDDDQAIYGWRGADVRNILEFTQDYQNVKVIKLEENYRSTQKILDLANEVIHKNHHRMEKTLFTQQGDGQQPLLVVLQDDKAEAEYVINQIKEMSGQYQRTQIAILYRTNTQSRPFEEALLARDIPYRIFGSVSFFERREIKEIMGYLRFIANPADEMAFLRIINTPSRGMGDKTIDKVFTLRQQILADSGPTNFLAVLEQFAGEAGGKLRAALESLLEWINPLHKKILQPVDLAELFDTILRQSGLQTVFEEEDRLLGTNRLANLEELRNMLAQYHKDHPQATLQDFLLEKTLNTNLDTELTGNSEINPINMMTIHNAKGLEFDLVFVCGLDEDLMPHYLAKQEEDSIAEERRLFYVAITRARKKIILTRAIRRMKQGWYQNTQPSIFIEGLEQKQRIQTLNKTGVQRGYETQRTQTELGSYIRKNNFIAKNQPETKKPLNNIQINTSIEDKFRPGDKIKHSSFGQGKVLRIEGSGDTAKIHIFFDDKKSRKFLLKFTALTKI